jgi:tRNA modification GTPase
VHGSRAVISELIEAVLSLPGTRLAEPGEFANRAFANGKLDLRQIEGLADLINAETRCQREQALLQSQGFASARYEAWRQSLLRAQALVEAELDFADEGDVGVGTARETRTIVDGLLAEIAEPLKGRGERLRDGVRIVIAGAPNAGKSSLMNALARRDVAIVSEEAGTTRDLIEVRLDIDGYPFTIVDTAGLREASGAVEREGIRRARLRAGAADLVLAVADSMAPTPPATPDGPMLRVGTKADLIDSPGERSRLAAVFDVLVSSATGEGIDGLLALLAEFARDHMAPRESALITRARHRAGLTACRDALITALDPELPLELRAEELRHATDALGRLTGRVDVEDLFDVIFRDFCIGK